MTAAPEPEETSVREHLAELLEALEAGRVTDAVDWLRAALKKMDGGEEWPERLED